MANAEPAASLRSRLTFNDPQLAESNHATILAQFTGSGEMRMLANHAAARQAAAELLIKEYQGWTPRQELA